MHLTLGPNKKISNLSSYFGCFVPAFGLSNHEPSIVHYHIIGLRVPDKDTTVCHTLCMVVKWSDCFFWYDDANLFWDAFKWRQVVKEDIYQASFHHIKGWPTLFLTFCNFQRHLHMFLDILELGIENKLFWLCGLRFVKKWLKLSKKENYLEKKWFLKIGLYWG